MAGQVAQILILSFAPGLQKTHFRSKKKLQKATQLTELFDRSVYEKIQKKKKKSPLFQQLQDVQYAQDNLSSLLQLKQSDRSAPVAHIYLTD